MADCVGGLERASSSVAPLGCSIHSISPELGASCGCLLGDRSKGRKSSPFPHHSHCKAPPTSAESALSCLMGCQVYPKCCSSLFSDKKKNGASNVFPLKFSVCVSKCRFQQPTECGQHRRFSRLENRLQGESPRVTQLWRALMMHLL